MSEVIQKIVVSFPGQGGKDYKGSPNPEIALFRESIGNYQAMTGILPDLIKSKPYFFGYSFGLYAAATAAGVFPQEEAEILIKARSDLIRADEARRVAEGKAPTGMLLILGHKIDEIRSLVSRTSESYRAILVRNGLVDPDDLHHTNINGDTSHVVSGDYPFLQAIVDFLGEKKARLLPIQGMYHAKSRERVSEEYGGLIDNMGIKFREPSQPLISSTKPRLLRTGREVREEAINQIHTGVDVIRVVEVMKQKEIRVIIDPGPGQFANQSLRRINPDFKVLSFDVQSKPSSPLENVVETARNLLATLGHQGP